MPHRTPTVFLAQILLLGSIVLAAPAQAPPPPAADPGPVDTGYRGRVWDAS